MVKSRSVVRAATLAACALSPLFSVSATRADDKAFSLISDIKTPQYLDENQPGPGPAVPPALNTNRAPLMSALDHAGAAQTLDRLRVNIFGYIEGSVTHSFSNPSRNINLGREFDINNDRLQINQIDLKIERKADMHQWDIGGMWEMFYGTDARFTPSSDFLGNSSTSHPGSTSSSSLIPGPEYQYDIPQLYLDLTAPIGNGLRIRFGKFLFFKQIDPNASVFYSHSFTFGAALPFTLTGLDAYYPISDDLSVEGGFSRGWGQTFTDNNGAIDAFGRVKARINKQTDASFAFIIGPELDHDNSHYRVLIDGTLTHEVNDRLTLLFDGIFGSQAQPSGTDDSLWYGLSTYAVYKICDGANFNLRGEFYRDENGLTTGQRQTLFEITAGFTLTPFPKDPIGQNLKVRPEVRWDYSTKRYFSLFQDHDQFTFAIDAYFDY